MTTGWHAAELHDVLRELDVDPAHGLAAPEAAARLARDGPNSLAPRRRSTRLRLLVRQFTNTLVLILLAATVLSAILGDLLDAGIILAIVLFCTLLGYAQEHRAERALEALRDMLAPVVTVLRDGQPLRVPSDTLVAGDVLLLEAGDRIAADGRLVNAHGLRCDEAALTGESFAADKETTVLPPSTPVADRRNSVFAGTSVSTGRGRAVVTGTGTRTEFGQIAERVGEGPDVVTPLEKRTAEIGRWLGGFAAIVCVGVAAVSVGRAAFDGGVDLPLVLGVVMFAIALAVAAVPEALAAIVTGALAIGMHEMAKRRALVRRMPAVETLGCTTVICTDKTGTLTRGEMTVRRIVAGGTVRTVTGTGFDTRGTIAPPPSDDRDGTLRRLLAAGVLCNDAALTPDGERWRVRGDPTEGSLLVLAAKAGVDADAVRADAPRVEEFPFTSERKRMCTIHRSPDGHVAYVKGAPEIVAARCLLTDIDRGRLLEMAEAMAADGLRVLAFASRRVEGEGPFTDDAVERTLDLLGLVGMMDPPREEAKEAVAVCREVQIRTVMITGDHRLTAVAIARELGIVEAGDLVLTGSELDAMSDEAFLAVVERVSVYARVSPLDKLRIVRALQTRGHVVAMTGDGVNDAPALKHADIGIAMGLNGTDVAREAADMVLADDNFATIVRAIEQGRWIYENIKKYLTYLLRANITEVVVLGGAAMAMGPEYLPLLPASILYINLATDGLPALALGVSPPDPDIMRRPPRPASETVFTREVLALVLMAVLVECPVFLWVFAAARGDLEGARTAIFLLFVVVELAIAVNFRSLRYSVFRLRPHAWLIAALAWEAILLALVLQWPSIRHAFGIRLPTAADLGLVLAVSVFVFATIEATKAAIRRTGGAAVTIGTGRPHRARRADLPA